MIFDIFKGKSVLVTGHTGFKGSWLSLWLHKLGADVHGYALPPNTTPNNYAIASVGDILASECLADIRDRTKLREYIDEIKPDCIFHLAAQPIVRKSYSEPVETFESNIMGSIYLMDIVRVLKRPCSVVMITSDKCYENVNKKQGYIETDPMGGFDPYSASKGCAELAISSYRRSFFPYDKKNHGVKLASVRAGNVIGGGDWAEDRIIPDAVRAVISGNALEIRNPYAVRPWQHVLEPLSGYMLLAAKLLEGNDFADGWNFGPLHTKDETVSEIIDLFYATWGKGTAKYDMNSANPHEASYLTLSSEKSMRLLGWKPIWNIEETVKRTAYWYKKFYEGADAKDLVLDDIRAYSKKIVY